MQDELDLNSKQLNMAHQPAFFYIWPNDIISNINNTKTILQ